MTQADSCSKSVYTCLLFVRETGRNIQEDPKKYPLRNPSLYEEDALYCKAGSGKGNDNR